MWRKKSTYLSVFWFVRTTIIEGNINNIRILKRKDGRVGVTSLVGNSVDGVTGLDDFL